MFQVLERYEADAMPCPHCRAQVRFVRDESLITWMLNHKGQVDPACLPAIRRALWPALYEGV
jgi:hypothetical protein